MSKEPREIELKLGLDPADVRRVKRFLGRVFGGAAPVARALVSVYFDTPELALRTRGISLRVRRVGRRYVQTVKVADGQTAGIFDRPEWEHTVSGPDPDLSQTKGTALEHVVSKRISDSLRPIFQTSIRRTTFRLSHSGSQIDASVDEGFVKAGKRRAPLCELELERVRGETERLFSVAKALDCVVPLRLCVKSKADCGYELLRRHGAGAEPAAAVHLLKSFTSEEAFRVIGRQCLGELIRNEPSMLGGGGEALHRMRIALRRLRAAIATFSRMVGDRHCAMIKADLAWVTGELGPARDLDVFIAEVLTPLRKRHIKAPGFPEICRDFEERRTTAYRDAATAIRSHRYRKLTLDTAEWLETGPWTRSRSHFTHKQCVRPILKYAVEQLARRHRKLRNGPPVGLRDLSPVERHKLRIRGKTLRYATECFADLFTKPKSVRRRKAALSALKDLQASLGALNDVATRESLAAHVALSMRRGSKVSSPLAKAFSAGVIFGEQDARIAQLLESAERAYARLLKTKPFWK